MNQIENNIELEKYVNKTKETNVAFSISIDTLQFSTLYFLNNTFLKVFNKMHVFGNLRSRFSVTFSLVPNWSSQEFKQYVNEISKYQKEEQKNLISNELVSNLSEVSKHYFNLPINEQCSAIEYVANNVFTKSFLANNKLGPEEILETITQLKSDYVACEENQRLNFRKDKLFLRWEERQSEMRVILFIDVLTMRTELSYANLEEVGVLNPLTNFVEDNFGSDGYMNFFKRHDLLFLETQGAKKFPLAHNNIQDLRLTFSVVNDNIGLGDVWARSAKVQGVWLKKIISTLHLFCPLTDEGNLIKLKEEEQMKLPLDKLPGFTGKNIPTSYSGARMYTTALWRIYLQFDVTQERDDYGNPYTVNFISARVEPFCQNHDLGEGARYYHPLIYEWEK
jgi:hypothetical protein